MDITLLIFFLNINKLKRQLIDLCVKLFWLPFSLKFSTYKSTLRIPEKKLIKPGFFMFWENLTVLADYVV